MDGSIALEQIGPSRNNCDVASYVSESWDEAINLRGVWGEALLPITQPNNQREAKHGADLWDKKVFRRQVEGYVLVFSSPLGLVQSSVHPIPFVPLRFPLSYLSRVPFSVPSIVSVDALPAAVVSDQLNFLEALTAQPYACHAIKKTAKNSPTLFT